MSTADEPPIAIDVHGVTKSFKLPHEKQTSIKSALVNFGRGVRGYERQQVLKGVSFTIHKGEFFGIVGRNGSGKSTLLRLLAGIYAPSGGHIKVNGKLTPFIELGVGFNPELTGRENVYLNGALLGFNRREMDQMYGDIVEFAELGKFMDQKLKNYSSGMQVRLAFSIAIRAKSDVLVLDEVLAVGDLDFQQKCYNYFNELKRGGQTVVLVTHDMSAVRRFCDRAMLIDNGKIQKVGTPDEVAGAYEKLNVRRSEKRLQTENQQVYKEREGNGEAVIDGVETFSVSDGMTQSTFMANEKIGVRITYTARQAIGAPALGFIFQDGRDVTVFAANNIVTKLQTKPLDAGESLVLEAIVDNVFTDGEYSITCAIESADLQTIYDRIEHMYKFLIGGHPLAHATTHPEYSLQVVYDEDRAA